MIGQRKLRFIGGLAAVAMLASACGGNGDGAASGDDIPSGGDVTQLDLGVIYGAVADRDPCNFGEVFTTDGRIAALDLVVIEDDQIFFPIYNPSVTVRAEVVEAHPELRDLFAEVAGALDNDTMTELNRRVDVDGEFPEDVARDWLETEGMIS